MPGSNNALVSFDELLEIFNLISIPLLFRHVQGKNYVDASYLVVNAFHEALSIHGDAHRMLLTERIGNEFFKKHITYTSDELQKLFSARYYDPNSSHDFDKHTLIFYLAALRQPTAITFLANLHTEVSANDAECYQEAFKKLMDQLTNENSRYINSRREIVEACGALLSTKNATADWYLYAASDTSIMNEFARFGMTEYFKQGMAKGASIGLQKTGTNFITRKERSETPLDVALHYDQQPIIDLIKAEIKKEVEKMILETILETRLQKKEILTLDDFSELDRRIKKTVDSKFGHCKTDIANCYVAVTRTETQLELFLDMQEASIAANEALDAIILGDKNFRFTKKLLNTVINSMRKIFGYREFSGIEDILNDIAHQIIGMKKRELLRPVAKATQSQQPIAAADTFILLDDVELAEILKPLETSVLQGVVSPISADKANVLKGTVAPANPYSFLDGLTDFDRQQIVTLDTLDDAQRAEILELLIKTSILQSVVSPIIPADEANTRKGTVASANPYSFLGGLTDFGRQQKDLEAARRAVPAISSAAPAAKAHPTPSNAHEEEMAIVKKLRVPNSALFVLPAAPKLAATPSADESDEELKEFSKVIA